MPIGVGSTPTSALGAPKTTGPTAGSYTPSQQAAQQTTGSTGNPYQAGGTYAAFGTPAQSGPTTPNYSFSQSTQQPVNAAPYNPYTTWAQGQTAVINAAQNTAQSGYDVQGANAQASYNQGVGALNAGYGYDSGRLADNYNRLGADTSLQQAQVANTNNVWDANQQRYTNQGTYLQQQADINAQQYNNQNTFIGNEETNSQNRFNQQGAYNNQQKGTNQRGLEGALAQSGNTYDAAIAAAGLTLGQQNNANVTDNTNRGSILSQGFGTQLGFNNQQYGNTSTAALNTKNDANTQAQLGWDTTNNQLNFADQTNAQQLASDTNEYEYGRYGRTANETKRANDLSTTQQQEASNDLQKQNDADSYALSTAQNSRNQTYLDATASDYGIQGSQLKDTLQRGISKLGLDYNTTVTQLANLSAQNNNDAQAQKQALTYALLNASAGQGPTSLASAPAPTIGTPPAASAGQSSGSVPGRTTIPNASGVTNKTDASPRIVQRDANGNVTYDSQNPRYGKGGAF